MPSVGFGGPGGSAFSPGPFTSGPIGLPSGRAMANGSTQALMYLSSILVGGNTGAVGGVASLGGSSGGWSAGVSAPAYVGVGGAWALVNGGSDNLTITRTSGTSSIRVGRAGGGTTSFPGNSFSGTIGGSYFWAQAPTAPSIASVVPDPGGEAATISFSAPGDSGDTAITGYLVQRALDSGFTTGVVNSSGGGSPRVITGLTPGTRYYWRVTAQNLVTSTAGALGGAWSSTISVEQPTPGGSGLIRAGAWVDAAGLIRATTWVESSSLIRAGGAWVAGA